MNCHDNGKLRAPLDAVCQTTDIGCVPITNGRPTCSPQPDELPFAFDPNTSTLWIFSCKTRTWIEFSKFSMCQLGALNLDNIKNICDVLNIGVNYSGSGECVQGTITLAELVERIKECLTLETKIITIGQGDGNKIKISIDGLPNLPPVYVTGRNIWSEGGSGTEADPLRVATYDPICQWPNLSQEQIDGIPNKQLGACVNGNMHRVPFPPKVCELPHVTREVVEGSTNKTLVACVNGEGVNIPFPPKPCEFPSRTQAQVDATNDKNLIACVDGKNVKVPFPPTVCEFPAVTLQHAKSNMSNITIAACESGNEIRIPLEDSGFFDREYFCVPLVTGRPSGAPPEGTGPLRVDCGGQLYVWLCGQNTWLCVKDSIDCTPSLDPDSVADICSNLRMKGWVIGDDPCATDVKFTLNRLGRILEDCFGWWSNRSFTQIENVTQLNNVCTNMRFLGWHDADGDRVNGYITANQLVNLISNCTDCNDVFYEDDVWVFPFSTGEGEISGHLESVTLQEVPSQHRYVSPDPNKEGFSDYGYKFAIYNAWTRNWDLGTNGKFRTSDTQSASAQAGKCIIELTNENNDCDVMYSLDIGCRYVRCPTIMSQDYSVSVYARLISEANEPNDKSWWNIVADASGATKRQATCGFYSKNYINGGPFNVDESGKSHHMRETWYGHSAVSPIKPNTANRNIWVSKGETKRFYLHLFCVLASKEDALAFDGGERYLVQGFGAYCRIRKFLSVKLI